MIHTLLGAEKFRAGSDLYFERHDGQAVTCDDFVAAMANASGVDLTIFKRWYAQAGTPRLTATISHDAIRQQATLTLSQVVPPTPSQPVKQPMTLPIRMALFNRETGTSTGESLVVLETDSATLTFDGFSEPPVLSINRDFSAPVVLDTNRSEADLAFLAAVDDDPFARYEAMQQLMIDTLVGAVSTGKANHTAVVESVGDTLADTTLDPAFVGEAVGLPSEAFIGDQMLVVDPDAIAVAREALRSALATAHLARWRAIYAENGDRAFKYSPAAKGARRIRNVALTYIIAADPAEGAQLAFDQFAAADNMTDRLAALTALANSDAEQRVPALDIFYQRYRDNALVLDKWFTAQAMATRSDTVDAVIALERHPDFTLANPNRFRALVGAFGVNQRWLHSIDGRGYAFFANQIIALDPVNAQTAAKMVPSLGRWRRFDSERQALMLAALERILATPGLSKDVFEQVSKSLA